jgi:phytoene synthase
MQVSQGITRRSASNLALAFIMLPKPKRDSMAVLYAFCREIDDVVDEEAQPLAARRERLAVWREDLRKACAGGQPELPVNRELQPVIAQYGLSFEMFEELLRGVQMDLEVARYGTYQELEVYCYRVASVVGLLSIEIFGYQDPACRQYAIYLGKALQFTNILRDVRADAERGRIYLPQSELTRFDVTPEEILAFQDTARFRELAESVANRAKAFYGLAQQTLPDADRPAMVAAELMGSVYWRLLRKIEARHFSVMNPRPTRLNKAFKLSLVLRSWLGLYWKGFLPSYGRH